MNLKISPSSIRYLADAVNERLLEINVTMNDDDESFQPLVVRNLDRVENEILENIMVRKIPKLKRGSSVQIELLINDISSLHSITDPECRVFDCFNCLFETLNKTHFFDSDSHIEFLAMYKLYLIRFRKTLQP